MSSGKVAGLVFLFLALVTSADRLGYLEVSSIVFLALVILGGAFMVLGRALHTYQAGRVDETSDAQSPLGTRKGA